MSHIYVVFIKGKKVKFMCEHKLMKWAQLTCCALQTTGTAYTINTDCRISIKLKALVSFKTQLRVLISTWDGKMCTLERSLHKRSCCKSGHGPILNSWSTCPDGIWISRFGVLLCFVHSSWDTGHSGRQGLGRMDHAFPGVHGADWLRVPGWVLTTSDFRLWCPRTKDYTRSSWLETGIEIVY